MGRKKIRNVEWQAIINVTPDSFSDGGVNNSPVLIETNIKNAYELGCRHFDFGAQSTAPTSKEITFAEELGRLEENLFPLFCNREMKKIFSECRLSFDTFRVETIFKVVDTLDRENLRPKEILWNDVSGVVSEDVFQFLKRKNTAYVLCHNLADIREKASQHMDYVSELNGEDFILEMGQYFKERIEVFPEDCLAQVVIDPCFGFSKTREQNIYLLQHLETLSAAVGGNFRYLIGISRKKFIRELSGFNLDNIDRLDHFHNEIISRSLMDFPYFSYIRSHVKPI